MVYTFMSGTQCRPQRRRLSRSSRRYSRSSVNLGSLDKHRALPVHNLSRSVDSYLYQDTAGEKMRRLT